jgi:hypothetical protein
LWAFLLTALAAVVGPFVSSVLTARTTSDHQTAMWFRAKKHDAYEKMMVVVEEGYRIALEGWKGDLSPYRERMEAAVAMLGIYAPREVYAKGEEAMNRLAPFLALPHRGSEYLEALDAYKEALDDLRMGIRKDVRRRTSA